MLEWTLLAQKCQISEQHLSAYTSVYTRPIVEILSCAMLLTSFIALYSLDTCLHYKASACSEWCRNEAEHILISPNPSPPPPKKKKTGGGGPPFFFTVIFEDTHINCPICSQGQHIHLCITSNHLKPTTSMFTGVIGLSDDLERRNQHSPSNFWVHPLWPSRSCQFRQEPE